METRISVPARRVQLQSEPNRSKRCVFIYIIAILFFTMSAIAQQDVGKRSEMATRRIQAAAPESPISGTKAIVKVLAVKDNAAPATEYEKPDADKKLVAVQVIVDNRAGTEDIDVSGLNFKVKDEDGGVYDVSLADSSDQPTLKSGSVESGELVKGWITFELPNAVKAGKLRLRYELADRKTAWIQMPISK
jgi:hypothetical protein